NGGQGSDTLLGGTGVDTYVLNTGAGQGIDTVLDSDRTGYLRDDTTSNPIVLTGGDQFGDNRVFRGKDANGVSHLYTFVTGNRSTGGDLMVDGAMLIKDYKPGQGNDMGITMSGPAAQANPTTTHDIKGDPLIHSATVSSIPSDWVTISSVSNGNGTYTVEYFLVDADRNPIEGGYQSRNDYLSGTGASDHIKGLGGIDTFADAVVRAANDSAWRAAA
ncbi:MAG: hypothetical protein PXX77_10350, partial [Gallionella sp.]|nr:hypothetical protein [Gallionella sp.]